MEQTQQLSSIREHVLWRLFISPLIMGWSHCEISCLSRSASLYYQMSGWYLNSPHTCPQYSRLSVFSALSACSTPVSANIRIITGTVARSGISVSATIEKITGFVPESSVLMKRHDRQMGIVQLVNKHVWYMREALRWNWRISKIGRQSDNKHFTNHTFSSFRVHLATADSQCSLYPHHSDFAYNKLWF